MLRIPKTPLRGVASKTPSNGYNINTSEDKRVKVGQQSLPTYSRQIESGPLNSFIDSKRNRKISLKKFGDVPLKKKVEPSFKDINDNMPFKGQVGFIFNALKIRNREFKPPKFYSYFFMTHSLNKFLSTHYQIATEQLRKTFMANSIAFRAEIITFFGTIRVDPNNLPDNVGSIILHFIRKEQYARHFIRWINYGRPTPRRQGNFDSLDSALDFDLKKAIQFEKIATVSILLSTISGVQYMVKPRGVVHVDRKYKINQKFGYQELDFHLLGYSGQKMANVLSPDKLFLDEISLYYGFFDLGPIFVMMHEPPHRHCHYERCTNNRLKCILMNGTNNLLDRKYIEYAADDVVNYYEKLKRGGCGNEKNAIKTYEHVMKNVGKEVNTVTRLNILQRDFGSLMNEYNNSQNKYETIIKQTKSHEIWELLYKHARFTSNKLVGNQIGNKFQELHIKKGKTVLKVMESKSRKSGTLVENLRLQGIDMHGLPNIDYNSIRCAEIENGIRDEKKTHVCIVP